MDLLFVVAILYALQCISYVPSNAVLFRGVVRRAWVSYGGGLRFLNPWPSAFSIVSARLPFALTDLGVQCTASPHGFGIAYSRPVKLVAFEDLARLTLSGTTIRLGRRPFVRGVSHSHANQLHSLLVRLGEADPEARPALLAAARRAAPAEGRFADVTQATWWLGLCCDLYVMFVFVYAPVLTLLVQEDWALKSILPFVGSAHVVAVFLVYRAQRLLVPHDKGALIDRLLVCALYPPALWRAPQDLVNEGLAGPHPAAVAQLMLERTRLLTFLRGELALLHFSDRTREVLGTDRDTQWTEVQLEGDEGAALKQLALGREVTEAELLAPKQKQDPHAASYCPLCNSEYLPGVVRCADCEVPTRRWNGSLRQSAVNATVGKGVFT